jgi:hypothetical protein
VGEIQEGRGFRLAFNSSLRVDFQGALVSSDGGLLLVRKRARGVVAKVEFHLGELFPRVGLS